MASEVDIAKLALSHIGQRAEITSLDDASAEARYCKIFYPIARDEMLEAHTWDFATRRATLAELSVDEIPSGWLYAYAIPSGCLRPVRVLRPPSEVLDLTSFPPETEAANLLTQTQQVPPDDDAQPFIVESLDSGERVLYTNVEAARLVYIAHVTVTGRFSPIFVTALSYKLGSYIAGPITKDDKKQVALLKMAEVFVTKAKISDTNGRKNESYRNFVPASIIART